jgi:aspartyl-tRNA(Asn)/glutamyl-tRNA(Gln) amidotransferase subunit C
MIEKDEVKKLAELARIKLTDEEISRFQEEIESILSYVVQVKEAGSVTEDSFPINRPRNVFRDDKDPHESGKFTEALISRAPKSEKGYIKVKKIL